MKWERVYLRSFLLWCYVATNSYLTYADIFFTKELFIATYQELMYYYIFHVITQDSLNYDDIHEEIFLNVGISSECSAQRQILHCKRRNHDCSSAKGRSSTANSGTQAAVLPGIE